MAAVELDIPNISSFCALPQTSLNSLLDNPTRELVQTLLENVSSRVREHEELKAEKLKLNVELENAVRSAESKNRVMKNSIEKGLRDVVDIRRKLDHAGSSTFWSSGKLF